MPQGLQDGDLIELLYAAAGHGDLWPQFLGRLGNRLHAPGSAFTVHYPNRKQYRIDAHVGLPPDSFSPYEKRYGALDPWFLGARKLRIGTAELGSSLCPPARFEKTAFYNEFMLEYNRYFYQCGIMLENREGNLAALTLLRERRQRDFNENDIRFLTKLSRHLQQALAIHRLICDSQEAVQAAIDVTERLDAALILVGGDGTFYSANRTGEQILEAGRFMTVQSGKLVCKDRSQAAAFQQLLHTAVERTLNEKPGGAITLHDRGRSLYATVLPGIRNRPLLAGPPIARVILTDPAAAPKSREQSLMELFGLTRAEARIAMLLLQGLETNEIAERSRNTRETVRYQLKQIYAKTGISGQNRIVRLLSQLPGLN